ncbi:MAG: hypothetical protein KKD77_22915 [Gammaproteobacteria bacterium]|nr:hypothetical protein [Gammaproteobacteria bacterium]
MKGLSVFIAIMLVCSMAYGSIALTNKEFKNLDVIDAQLRTLYPQYEGFNGSQNDMTVMGLDDATAKTAIDAMNIDALKENDGKRKAMKRVRQKLKALGFDNGDLKTMGFTNDIDD